MEWNTEKNFLYGMEGFDMEWKWQRKKIAEMEYGKIIFHSISCPVADPENFGGGDLKPKPQKFGCLHQS